MKLPHSSDRGFSLVEILIVITIIALLSGLGMSVMGAIQKNSRDAQREADLRVIQSALQQYYADQNKYPNTMSTELTNGSQLTNCTGRVGCTTVTKVYLNALPKDPTGTAYSFVPLYNISSTSQCSISAGVEVGTCHYYTLCAKKEGLAAGALCGSTNNYNFSVTPL